MSLIKVFFSDNMLAQPTTDLSGEVCKTAIHWADVLNDASASVPTPLPPFPENPEVDPFETFLSGWAKACAKAGLEAAQKIGHDPIAPHLVKTARPGASTFNQGASPLDWTPGQYDLLRVEGGPGVRIFIMRAPWNIGINRTTSIQPTADYTLIMEHGWLAPVGPAETLETPADKFTLVFTWEGPEIGWVLASVHPGEPDPPVNRDGLEEGQTFKGSDLLSRGFVRAIP